MVFVVGPQSHLHWYKFIHVLQYLYLLFDQFTHYILLCLHRNPFNTVQFSKLEQLLFSTNTTVVVTHISNSHLDRFLYTKTSFFMNYIESISLRPPPIIGHILRWVRFYTWIKNIVRNILITWLVQPLPQILFYLFHNEW